jgi:NADH-quinone oxidoreductase subunit G
MRVEGLQRIGEVPIYQADPIVRRSYSLQNSRDGASPCAWMHPTLMEKLGIQEGDRVKLAQGAGKAVLPAHANPGLALDCVRVASAHPLTADLGGMFDAISVERAS